MRETTIHPSAIVEQGAELGQGVAVGPFCHVGPRVRLGDGVTLKSHVVIAGDTGIGADTVIFPFACIGEAPQDLKFQGEQTRLVIGARKPDATRRVHVAIATATMENLDLAPAGSLHA